MAEEPRRLGAVMLTDLVGYTALTQKDEAQALRLLEEHRAILRPLFARHRGHEVKTIGDAFLVEFESALDATQCGIEIQRTLHQQDRPDSKRRIDLRIGIHVGDVVHRDGDVYGDAVNIVSRIEPLAEVGGVCISQTVFDQVRNKIDFPLRKLGPQQLKNVLFPMDVYQIEMPWSRQPGFGTPWIGRESELAQIEGAMDQAAKRVRSVFFITGEAGIGKSRLVDEAVEVARRKGFQVLRTRCVRAELSSPYAPWSEALRDFVRASPNQLVYKVCGNYSNEIVKLVPELAERLGQVPPAPALEPDQARLRFYEGVTQFFGNVAREAPLFLFLDDLQWADAPTLRLFAYAARSLRDQPIVLGGAFETLEEAEDTPLLELIRDLRRDHLGETVTLNRFSAEQVGELVAGMFGETEISPEFRQLLYDRTSGNPFYLAETLRSLVDEGFIYRTPAGRWERKEIGEVKVPKTIRDAIRDRFNRLDKGVQDTVRIAAVLGTTFSTDVLQRLSGLDEETLIQYLESAVDARVIREEATVNRSPEFSFTDVHVRDVLYSEMLAIRRARYHRQAAEAIEAQSKGRLAAVAADLAYHYREGHQTEKAREFSILAGEAARNVFAFEQAERQYRAALELLREAPDPGLEARVLSSLGAVHYSQGRGHLSVGEWDSAIRLFAQANEPLLSGELAIKLADLIRLNPELVDSSFERVEQVLESSRTLLESVPPSQQLALLYDMSAVWLVDQSKFDRAREMLERGVRLAQELGNKRAEMEMMDELAMVAPISEKDRVFEYLQAKVDYFSRPESYDPANAGWATNNLSVASLTIRADVTGAIQWAERSVASAQKGRNLGDEIQSRGNALIPALIWSGDLARAERELTIGLDASASTGKPQNLQLERALARLELAKGDLAAAGPRIARTLEASRRQSGPRARALSAILQLSAAFHLAEGDRETAIRELREALLASRELATNAQRAQLYASVCSTLAETLLDSPDAAGHVEETQHLQGEVHAIAVGLGNPFIVGLDFRLQAWIAFRRSQSKEAIARAEESISNLRKAGNPIELGRTLRFAARLYNEAGLGERAASALTEALAIFTRVGAAGDAKQTESEMGELGERSAPGRVAQSG